MTTVDIWVGTTKRARALCSAFAQSLRRLGVPFVMIEAEKFSGPLNGIAAFYGLAGNLREVYRSYRRQGKTTVLMDLGYWGRLDGGRLAGYHRVSVNGLHATEYFQRVRHPGDRLAKFGIAVKPWRTGADGAVLICGQSSKAAWVYGLAHEQWERETAQKLAALTRRPLLYRPKPNREPHSGAPPARLVSPSEPLDRVLQRDIWALATHHSNAAVDALIEGVPVFCADGVASALGRTDTSLIENPYAPADSERQQFLQDVAYTQWNVAEIEAGAMWLHLRSEGLIP